VLHEWKRLRDPDSFAKTKMFGRETLRRVRHAPPPGLKPRPRSRTHSRVLCRVCRV
jgi:hypothetical protein